MADLLPGTHRCAKCGEWWAQAHACPIATNFTKIDQRPEPDCRTCSRAYIRMTNEIGCRSVGNCVNADHYQPLPPVRLWRTT